MTRFDHDNILNTTPPEDYAEQQQDAARLLQRRGAGDLLEALGIEVLK